MLLQVIYDKYSVTVGLEKAKITAISKDLILNKSDLKEDI